MVAKGLRLAGAMLALLCSPLQVLSESDPGTLEVGNAIIHNFSPAAYGANAQVWSAVQDDRGLMYFGNLEDIIEFDGQNWRLIDVPSRLVRCVDKDASGVIYAGSINNLGYLAANSSGRLNYVSLNSYLPDDERAFGDVWSCHATSHGMYFVTGEQVYRWYNGAIRVYQYQSFKGYTIDDSIVLVHRERGISLLGPDGNIRPIPFFDRFHRGEELQRVVAVAYDDKRFLVMTGGKGMFLVDPAAIEDPAAETVVPFTTEVDPYILKHSVYRAVKVAPTHIAIATQGGGIVIIDNRGHLVQVINSQRGLLDDVVFGLFQDSAGDLWATTNNGISHISLSSPLTHLGKLNGLKSTVLTPFYHKNHLYIGTFNGTFTLPDYRLQTEEDNYRLTSVLNTHSYCFEMLNMDGALLAAVYQSVMHIDSGQARELTHHGAPVVSMASVPQFPDIVFLGVLNKLEMARFSYDDTGLPRLEVLDPGPISQVEGAFYRMVADQKGGLWVSSRGSGIYHLEWPGDELLHPRINHYGVEDGLPALADNDAQWIAGQIMVATSKGIYLPVSSGPGQRYRFQLEPTFGQYFHINEIPIVNLHQDTRGQLWAANNDQVGIVRLEQDGSYQWDVASMSLLQGNLEGIYQYDDRAVWLATTEGLYRYDLTKGTHQTAQFDALVRQVSVGRGREVFGGAYYNDSTTNEGPFKRIILAQPGHMIGEFGYQDNSIAFEYAASSFAVPGRNTYSYYLEGFDPDWSPWSSTAFKEYTNLAEGAYHFRARAQNALGQVGQSAQYAFTIAPPWYRTIWAYLSYLLLTAIVFVGVIRFFTWRLLQARRRLQQIVNDKTAEVVAQKDEIERQAVALRKTNLELEKLSIVASETDNAVLIMDPGGTFEWVNKGFERLYGYDLAGLIERRGDNLVATDPSDSIRDHLQTCTTEHRSVSYELSLQDADGKRLWIQSTLTPILDDAGAVAKLVAIDSNITELKKAQEAALTHAHRAGMADLAVHTMHNVGNSLNSATVSLGLLQELLGKSPVARLSRANELIRTNQDRLEDFLCRDEKGKKLIQYYFGLEQNLTEEEARMQEIIVHMEGQLLSISNVVATQSKYAKGSTTVEAETEIDKIIDDALIMEADTIESNTIKIERDYQPIPTIPIQHNKLIQVFINLIKNAVEAMSDVDQARRVLKLSVETDDQWIRVRVQDSGRGIAQKDIARVFNPDFSTRARGRGLGLHDSANFVTEMGGKLSLASSDAAVGATFEILLPLAKRAA